MTATDTDGGVRISVYDLDRTITSLPTWTPFLLFAAARVAPWRFAAVPAVGLAALGRALRLYGRDRLKEQMHRLMLGRSLAPGTATHLADRFAERLVADHVRPGALAQLAADRAEGRRIVIATAAHYFYARAIADRLGVVDLVATQASRDAEGNILPALKGANCYGPAKLAMLEQWLAETGVARSEAHVRFHSDHVSDAPTFEWADEPIAINPHASLRALATARGWRVLDWNWSPDAERL